jgi:uncharacterized protein YecT (DUF1311 family)
MNRWASLYDSASWSLSSSIGALPMSNASLKYVGATLIVAALAMFDPSDVRAQSQSGMNAAAQQELGSVEKKLQNAVVKYRQRLNAGQLKAFDESQRLWLSYRKAACDFQSSGVAGGSALPMILAYCLRDHAVERLKVLDYLANCQEGDLSCPAFEQGT